MYASLFSMDPIQPTSTKPRQLSWCPPSVFKSVVTQWARASSHLSSCRVHVNTWLRDNSLSEPIADKTRATPGLGPAVTDLLALLNSQFSTTALRVKFCARFERYRFGARNSWSLRGPEVYCWFEMCFFLLAKFVADIPWRHQSHVQRGDCH